MDGIEAVGVGRDLLDGGAHWDAPRLKLVDSDCSPLMLDTIADCGPVMQVLDVPKRVGTLGGMIISTMNDLPGYQIDEVLGEVFGLTVRSRNVGSQIGASFKSLVGGELKGMTKMLVRGPPARPGAPGRGGRGQGRQRGPRLPLRHLRARLDLDRDLRLRHRRARDQALTVAAGEPAPPPISAGLGRRGACARDCCRSCRRRRPRWPRTTWRLLLPIDDQRPVFASIAAVISLGRATSSAGAAPPSSWPGSCSASPSPT